MANTDYHNFGTLTGAQLQAWSRDFWKVARNQSFINQFAGTGSNAMVQRVTELTKSQKGTKANITLLADMTGDGITGDNTLEGNEEALRAYDISIELDQLRFANRIAGRMADQKTVVNFREQSRDALAYAMADRIDQLAFLTLSGVTFDKKNNGGTRATSANAGHELLDLEFAGDVSGPSDNRLVRIDNTVTSNVITSTDLVVKADDAAGVAQSNMVATDTLTYAAIVKLKAYAKDQYIRGIRGTGNQEVFHMFVTPQMMASLKLDPDFIANVRNAGVRGASNQLFAGSSSLMVDGVMIHEFRHVYNNAGGTKWGSGADVSGGRALFCGAQALAMADIGLPEMTEDTFDYGNQSGISVGKIFGLRKPKYNTDISGTTEDFGVIAVDCAM